MNTQTCSQCKNVYDLDTVSIPTPIPDKMCSNCGTVLTDEEILSLNAAVIDQQEA